MDSQPRTQSTVINYLSQLGFALKLECESANFIDHKILNDGFWEPLVVGALIGLVKPGNICVDVGANAGYLTVLMGALVGDAGRVLSFEPNQEILRKLERNIALNPNLHKRIHLFPCGLGSSETVMFVAPDTGAVNGNASLSSSTNASTTNATEVKMLDSLQLGKIDLMKIDVEGMELEVLRGSKATLRQSLPTIIFETLTTLPPEKHYPIEQELRALGYNLYCLHPDDMTLQQIAYPCYPQEDTIAIHPTRFPKNT
jgi:FkbM family methyltransferase